MKERLQNGGSFRKKLSFALLHQDQPNKDGSVAMPYIQIYYNWEIF